MTLVRMTRRCDELLDRGRHYKRRRRSRLVSFRMRAVVMTTRDGAGLNFLCAGTMSLITTTTILGRRLHVAIVL